MKTKPGRISSVIMAALFCIMVMLPGTAAANTGWVLDIDSNYSEPVIFFVEVSSPTGAINFHQYVSLTDGMNFGTIPNGTILPIVEIFYNKYEGLMYGLTAYNRMGWISLRQTTILRGREYGTPEFTVTATPDGGKLNMRAGAGTDKPVIDKISSGTLLRVNDIVYNSSDGFFWGRIEYRGYIGWISLRQTSQEVETIRR